MNNQYETERLRLRPIENDDLENVFNALSDPKVIHYYGVSYKTKEATLEQMQWYDDLAKYGTGLWWAIISKKENSFCGAIGLNNLSKEHCKAEIGFWLLPEHWKKGIIQEVMNPVLDYAFQQRNLHRLEAFVEVGNTNSSKTLKKQGFRYEGTLRDCEIKNGAFINLEVYAKLSSD